MIHTVAVLLYRTGDRRRTGNFATWIRIPDGAPTEPRLDPAGRRAGLAAALEAAFDAEAETWWRTGRALSMTPSAVLAHAPACVANASDFGLMLAWSRLVRDWAAEPATTLVLCDDPWMFRHLRKLSGVSAGPAPSLLRPALQLWLRGYAARLAAALRFAAASVILRGHRRRSPVRAAMLLVYGHPASLVAGQDGYFGDLMERLPALGRILHVDCPSARAHAIAAHGRTTSLHAFGSLRDVLTLPFARWRPSRSDRRGPFGWLVRRAAAREGGTAQAAAIRWQIHCQQRWLRQCRPAIVAWPWENHSWERAMVRAARALGIRTVGYQHSVIGRQMLNYAPASNPDGDGSLPDRVFCAGPATRAQLMRWGVDPARLAVAGALRFGRPGRPAFDPAAPVFVALPFDQRVAAEMIAAVRRCAADGRHFLIKDHPMTPFAFADSHGVRRADQPLGAQQAVSAVLYAATTVGLEAVLAGLPTLRFLPTGRIALDILPAGINVPVAEADSLGEALRCLTAPSPVDTADVFAPVDEQLWRDALTAS